VGLFFESRLGLHHAEPRHKIFRLFGKQVLTTALIIAGFLVAVMGLIGCILPVLPGPLLSFLSLLILSMARSWTPFSPGFLITLGVLTGIVFLLDYLIPLVGAKRYGASRFGLWGSVMGMLIGIFLFPPFGLFVGGFLGAVIGELFSGKTGDHAFRAGVGVFVGNVLATGLKLGLCGVILFYYIREMF
jgi:uncharacterized protein YqgC (DUF456 family)